MLTHKFYILTVTSRVVVCVDLADAQSKVPALATLDQQMDFYMSMDEKFMRDSVNQVRPGVKYTTLSGQPGT